MASFRYTSGLKQQSDKEFFILKRLQCAEGSIVNERNKDMESNVCLIGMKYVIGLRV